jgi:nitrogen fixation/metabolism regulation signal transduction histidine kinase
VLIAVTDMGCGMPSEIVAKAIDPVFTTRPVGKDKAVCWPSVESRRTVLRRQKSGDGATSRICFSTNKFRASFDYQKSKRLPTK